MSSAVATRRTVWAAWFPAVPTSVRVTGLSSSAARRFIWSSFMEVVNTRTPGLARRSAGGSQREAELTARFVDCADGLRGEWQWLPYPFSSYEEGVFWSDHEKAG